MRTLALTLTLSPKEREQPSRSPFPWGRGPGEGKRNAILTLALILSLTSAFAQPRMPRIGYIYPAGGKAGTTFEIKVGGQFLDGVTNAFITGDEIFAEVTDLYRPMPQGQFNKLRDRMQELRDQRQAARRENSTNIWTAANQKELDDIRDQILRNPPNRNATPAIADVATVRISIPTNAAPGERELRLLTRGGLSNPMKFCIGTLDEFSAISAQTPNPDAERLRSQFGLPPIIPATNVVRVATPAIINGQIMPGEADRYRFNARRGAELVVAVSARDLIPYLADAVPGWFQATVAIYDSKGKELAYADDFRFQPDPVLHFAVPRDGEYVVEIRDSIYRGREDFVYRIALGELPYVTSIFPLGGRIGEAIEVELTGWNLPDGRATIAAQTSGIATVTPPFSNLWPARMAFAANELPEINEYEPNNSTTAAQSVTLPIIVNGRIASPGDTDVFQIKAHAGETVVAEVTARRLNSPLDSVLRLCDATGAALALNDDCEDRACGLNTHHADSQLTFRIPREGTYFLHLADTQRHGGPEYAYRLRLSAPRPDFELRAVPASLSVRPGDRVQVRIVALRKEGFTNEVSIALRNPPAGFKLTGGRIAADTNEVMVTLTAPFTRDRTPFKLAFEGRARTEAGELVRPVVPADDMMQAFFYRHLVPAQELQVAVAGRNAQPPAKVPAASARPPR